MTTDEMVKLLEAIHRLALVPYPFPEDARATEGNEHLIMALGEIAGIAGAALDKNDPELPRTGSERIKLP